MSFFFILHLSISDSWVTRHYNLPDLGSSSKGLRNNGLLTYLLTPWCRVLLEKLTGLQLVKKFPAFHGTPRFITALTSVRHLSLSWASLIQSIHPHSTSWRSVLILITHLRLSLPIGLLPSGFHTKTLYIFLAPTNHILRPAHPNLTFPNTTTWQTVLPSTFHFSLLSSV